MHQNIAAEVRDVISAFQQEAKEVVEDGQKRQFVTLTGYNGHQHPLGESVSPVQNFAQKNDMPEIMGGYKMPGDLKFGELQDCMVLLDESLTRGEVSKEQYKDKIDRIWGTLKDMNPELKQIKIKSDDGLFGAFKNRMSTHQKRAAIIGVDDGYNVTDIDFFLNNFLGAKNSMNMNGLKTPEARAYHDLSQRTQQMCGRCSWRPSPQTLSYASEKVQGRSPSPADMHGGRIPSQGTKPVTRPLFGTRKPKGR